MKNERIQEALCHIFNVTAAPYPWAIELGPHTDFEIAITRWDMDAPRPTQEELDAAYVLLAKEDRKAEIYRELDALDLQSIRPVRAKQAGMATPEDEAKIVELEAKAQTLRTELGGLNGQV